MRVLSDHCPLLLFVDEENWGPRPSRMLKCWNDTPVYKQFVSSKWKSLQIDEGVACFSYSKLTWENCLSKGSFSCLRKLSSLCVKRKIQTD